MNKKIRVMIVEDSITVVELLKNIINKDPRLEVAAVAESGEKALKIVENVKPDVISLDIRLPGINGFEVTQKIMQNFPTPIVVFSASLESEELKISMNALRAGALAVLEKPVGITHIDFEEIAKSLCTQLVIMSEVKVVRQWFPRKLDFPVDKENFLLSSVPGGEEFSLEGRQFSVVGIAASTGGPAALLELLGHFPRNFPLPILLVQHISLSFYEGFVQWMNSLSPLPVLMVTEKIVPLAGKIYTAMPDHHLVARKGYVLSCPGEAVSHQRPSATVLFQSLAKSFFEKVIGVLLTGMGNDGAVGLKAIKDAGGYTIAEDITTSIIYGMPASAVRLGAVCESLPLYKIAPRIMEIIDSSKETSENDFN